MTRRLTFTAAATLPWTRSPANKEVVCIPDASIVDENGADLGRATVLVPYHFHHVPYALRLRGRVEADATLGEDGAWTVTKSHIDEDVRDLCNALETIERKLRVSNEAPRDGSPKGDEAAKTMRAIRAVAAQMADEAADPEYARIYRGIMKEGREARYDAKPADVARFAQVLTEIVRDEELAATRAAETQQYAYGTLWYGRRTDLTVIGDDAIAPFIRSFVKRLENLPASEQLTDAVNAVLGSLMDASTKAPDRSRLYDEIILGASTDLARTWSHGPRAFFDALKPEVASRIRREMTSLI